MVDKSFELKPREEKDNPMQAVATRERLAAVHPRAAGLGLAILPAWDREHAPADSEPAIREAAASSEFSNDAWGRPFHIVLSRRVPEKTSEKDDARFATLHSDGPDMKPETDDDVVFDLFRDGRLEAQ
jgi:hypothetical protein